MAIAYDDVGDHEGALRWIERAYEERDPGLVFLNAGSMSEKLSSDPRFQDLLRRIGFPGS